MYSHYYKEEYPALSITVVGLMILSGVVLLFGGVAAVTMMLVPDLLAVIADPYRRFAIFITYSFGPIISAFLIFAIAELIQLLMKIEINTRKGSVKIPTGWRRK